MDKPTIGPRRTAVLELVLAGMGGTAISRELGMSRARVYQHITELKRRGYLKKGRR